MEKTISSNQASLILVLFTVALKLSVLPAVMSDFAANNSYIICAIALVFDFLGTLVIVLIISKIPQKSFFELIKETLSKPVAIIIYVFLFIYFFCKCIIALLELHDYYIATLFEELNPAFFILVVGLLLLFMFNKSFRTIGRLLEVVFWPMAIGILFTLIFPMSDIDFTNLLPFMQDGFYPIWNGLVHTSFAFGDYMILLILMGHIQFRKNSTKKILIYMSSILNFIINFYIIFVGSFGDTAVNQTLALGELPLHNPYPATIGKLEWLTIIIWTAILIIQSILLGKCCCKCFACIFGNKTSKIPSIVTTILITVTLIVTYLRLDNILTIYIGDVFPPVVSSFQLFLVILLVFCYFIHKKKNKPFAIDKRQFKKEDKARVKC